MNRDFVKEIFNITVKEYHRKGYFLFREGNAAKHSYILLKGCVRLSIGETGHGVYTVDHPGEVFGWSSLLGRDTYSASAECRQPTKLLKINRDKLEEILERDLVNGFIFFKGLAATLGNRLLQTYRMISGISQAEMPLSFGTGQVQESHATFS
jgi:CRP-like cAMP-binding protein